MSHKAYGLMKRLGNRSLRKKIQEIIRPNEVASRFIEMEKIQIYKDHSRTIKAELRKKKKHLQ